MSASGDQPDLGAALGFDAADLERNRSGLVSERQRTVLQAKRHTGNKGLLFIGAFAVVFVVVVAVVIIPNVDKHQPGSSKVPIGAIVGGVLALVLLVMASSILRTRRRIGRLASGAVHEVVGPAKTRVHHMAGNVGDVSGSGASYGGGVRFELTLGKTMFFIPTKAMLDVFVPGATYRAFYATGGHRVYNTILSVERLA